MNKKFCSKCGVEKPINEFHKKAHSKCGHRSECKICTKLKYIEDKSKPKIDINYKTCSVCFIEKPISDFNKKLQSSDGYNSFCKL